MPISAREQADFPTALPKDEAKARLEQSLGRWPRARVGGWVSDYRAVLVVLRVFRSGYVFDGRWTHGPDGAHLAGEFRPARFSWLFFPLAIGLITLTDLFVPAPQTSDAQAWAPVVWQRVALVAGLIGVTVVGGRVLWSTIGKSDVRIIREHLKATFPGADV
jgi:hypothetical protein